MRIAEYAALIITGGIIAFAALSVYATELRLPV